MDIVEQLTRNRVVRKGKSAIKWKTDKEGYKVKTDKYGAVHEIRMTPKEIRSRMIAGKRAARKRKGKQNQMNLKRKLSLSKRTWSK